LRGLSEVPALA